VDLYQRAGQPHHWVDIEAGRVNGDLLEFSDYCDVGVYEQDRQDDEAGIYSGDSAPDPWRQAGEAFRDQMEFTAAIGAINADFERRARPYRETMKRNPGPLLPELAALMRERDARIAEVTRAHQRAEALEWAARRQPANVATAHQRQLEQAAARAFATDLGRGRFLRDDPADAGRATMDIAVW
jgi:hypothetical protein